MRQLFLLLIVIPMFTIGQDKSVISSSRYFPKSDKIQQFEKALTAHAQKYHKGDFQWRVFSIETGPDAGGYHIVEGPASWDAFDKRGDLGNTHMDDWSSTVQNLLTDRTSTSFLTFRADLSTVQLNDYAEKVAVNHVFFKPGYYGDMQDNILNMKKVWEQSKQSVAVYESSSSGDPQFAIVTRYKQGLKERDINFMEPIAARYKKAHGEEGWTKHLEGVRTMVSHQWSEFLYYKPEFSSK